MTDSSNYKILKDKFKIFLEPIAGWQNLPVMAARLPSRPSAGRKLATTRFTGKEVLLEAAVLDGRGQAFTNSRLPLPDPCRR